jgi:hypothetical protein
MANQQAKWKMTPGKRTLSSLISQRESNSMKKLNTLRKLHQNTHVAQPTVREVDVTEVEKATERVLRQRGC